MRVADVKAKKLEEVVLPKRLVDWFGLVYQGILRKDEGTQIESDDCIQYGEDYFAFGGLIDAKKKLFLFTYFPAEGVKSNWTFELTLRQIKDMAQGKLTSLKLWSCQQEGCQTKRDRQDYSCFYHDYKEDGKPSPSKLTPADYSRLREQKLDLLTKWTSDYLRGV